MTDLERVKKAYFRLFNRVTDVIAVCPDEKTIKMLKNAQIECENIYIDNIDNIVPFKQL